MRWPFGRKNQVVIAPAPFVPPVTVTRIERSYHDYTQMDIDIHEGKLVGKPEFTDKETVLFPIPTSLQERAKKFFAPGNRISGYLGVLRNTQKYDRNGKPIYVRYFIPKGFDEAV